MSKKRFLISGGGTGGHVFPAIAIAKALQRRFPDAEFLFAGAKGKIEMSQVPAAGFPIEGLWISGLERKLSLKNLLFPVKVLHSLWKARRIINRFQPDVIIGVGGYASWAVVWTGNNKGIKTLLQEQNSYAGITNRNLGKKANTICVAYENMERFFPPEKIVLTGNPIRREVIDIEGKREKAAEYFGLDANKTTLLFVGGSLGALAINQSLENSVHRLLDSGYQVIWQTGSYYYEKAQQKAKVLNRSGLVVTRFIKAMDLGYAMGDIVVSRAGAMAISELSAIGKPVILVPLPTAAEDHQRMNALALVRKDAAEMILNKDAVEKLIPAVIRLAEDKGKQELLSRNIKKLGIKDADERIAGEVEKLLNSAND